MSFAAYQSFIDQFCERAGLPDSRSMYHGAEVRIGNTDFMLHHGGTQAPEMVMIYCGMGAVPPAPQRDAVLLGLLESNLHLFGGSGNQSFAFNRESEQILLTCALWLGEISGQSVLGMLASLDLWATEWRSNYLLGERASQTGGAMASHGRRPSSALPPHLARAFVSHDHTA